MRAEMITFNKNPGGFIVQVFRHNIENVLSEYKEVKTWKENSLTKINKPGV